MTLEKYLWDWEYIYIIVNLSTPSSVVLGEAFLSRGNLGTSDVCLVQASGWPWARAYPSQAAAKATAVAIACTSKQIDQAANQSRTHSIPADGRVLLHTHVPTPGSLPPSLSSCSLNLYVVAASCLLVLKLSSLDLLRFHGHRHLFVHVLDLNETAPPNLFTWVYFGRKWAQLLVPSRNVHRCGYIVQSCCVAWKEIEWVWMWGEGNMACIGSQDVKQILPTSTS